MKRVRALLFWCHLVVGVAVGAVVLIMSATGVLLTFQRQITERADLAVLAPSAVPPGARPLALDQVIERARAAEPSSPTAVKWYADAGRPVEVAFGRERTVFLDAATGAVLGTGNAAVREFFQQVTGVHRWLGGTGSNRNRGRAITGAANLGFLFLVVSGLFLWWPRNVSARAFRNVSWFRRGLSPKARDFNWHNVIGVWTLVPLFVIVLSGVVISYGWAGDLVYRVAGNAPPAGQGGGSPAPGRNTAPADPSVASAAIEPLRAAAERQLPGWRSIRAQLGSVGSEPVRFTIDRGTGGEPHKRAELALVPGTGVVDRWEPFAAGSPGRRARSILRFAHTGEVLGIPGQVVAGLASVGGVMLVWTGFALALRRLVATTRRGGAIRVSAAPKPGHVTQAA